MHPREFHNIKKNIFNIITVVDLTNTNTLGFVSASIMTLIDRGYPFRFGIVPIVETEGSLKMARLLYWLNDTYGTQMTMTFIRSVSSRAPVSPIVGELSRDSRCSTRISNKQLSTGIPSGKNLQSSSWRRGR